MLIYLVADCGYWNVSQGEIALLTDKPRLATVTALANTSLLELDKSSFMAVFADESSEALADFELRLFRCVRGVVVACSWCCLCCGSGVHDSLRCHMNDVAFL